MIQPCRHCGVAVLLSATGECPSCGRPQTADGALPEERRVDGRYTAAQLEDFRVRWARARLRQVIASVVMLGFLGLGWWPATRGSGDGPHEGLSRFEPPVIVAMIVLSVFMLANYRCPACKRILPRRAGRFCSMCGVRLKR